MFYKLLAMLGINSRLFNLFFHIFLRLALYFIYVVLAFFSWKIALTLFFLDITINAIRFAIILKDVKTTEYLFDYLRIYYNKQIQRTYNG